MILDLILILLVVILSCLFCMNNNDKKNKQYCSLTHIVIGLTVIVFYKLVRYYRNKQENNNSMNNSMNNTILNNENFTVAQSINDFIVGNTEEIINQNKSTLNDNILKEYTQKIDELTNEIKKLNNNTTQDTIIPQVDPNIDTISLESQQAYQQFQIDYLSKQIKNAQDIVNSEAISKSTQNYKPIKVFSSCVANANGTMSAEQPVNNTIQGLNPLPNVLNSSAGAQIASTSSQQSRTLSDLFTSLKK
jgi:hypothetical protein